MRKDIIEAYAEIHILLEYIPKEYRDEIPTELKNMFKNKRTQEYNSNIDKNNPFNKEKLKRETIIILAILQYNFWYKTNEEKENLKKIFIENEIKHQNKLKETYNIDYMFKNRKYY